MTRRIRIVIEADIPAKMSRARVRALLNSGLQSGALAAFVPGEVVYMASCDAPAETERAG